MNTKIYINGEDSKDGALVQWNPHPSFKGVSMKHILTGAETGGMMSTHMVKIDPHCEISIHIHEGKAELHEIVEGSGRAEVNKKTLEYIPGVVSFIPEDVEHNIQAGAEGLLLLAKFTPPLI